ncbi:hypothetical protein ABAC460_01170 [Asticcacaulis sp. AC460]|uniref:hypothetical protein n=1 Tax=Asticcacaulis sp. AC460 TaxID=1282360 RepID=UPI0003C3F8EB|nr:hypothetical protein [Asticcacaulis sp. AC460]ESQ93345.1 hypothetical protein ABAC460_01170 [Asticcacaulis sp. AC460]
MDNGTVPPDMQSPPDVKPSAPGPNPAMSEAAAFADATSKLREGIAKAPLLSVGLAVLAGLSAALLIKPPKPRRRLEL